METLPISGQLRLGLITKNRLARWAWARELTLPHDPVKSRRYHTQPCDWHHQRHRQRCPVYQKKTKPGWLVFHSEIKMEKEASLDE